MAKDSEKESAKWQRREIDSLEDGTFSSDIAISKSPKGDAEGLQITTSRKVSNDYTKMHKGLWIPKRLVSKWFSWLTNTVTKLATLWGVPLEPHKEVEFYKNLSQDLSVKLDATNKKLQEAEERAKIKEEELKLARQVVDKLSDYEKAYAEFITEVKKQKADKRRDEKIIKQRLFENRWMLGLDCVVKAREKPIDTQASIDMHIQTEVGQDKIYEFKSPSLEPFKKDGDRRLTINQEFAEGINQLMQYLKKTDYRSTQSETGGYGIQKPVGTLIIGYSLEQEQIKLLKEWGYHLKPHIEIRTYEDVIDSAKSQLENIRYVREAEERAPAPIQ